jgi:hypothetical protein
MQVFNGVRNIFGRRQPFQPRLVKKMRFGTTISKGPHPISRIVADISSPLIEFPIQRGDQSIQNDKESRFVWIRVGHGPHGNNVGVRNDRQEFRFNGQVDNALGVFFFRQIRTQGFDNIMIFTQGSGKIGSQFGTLVGHVIDFVEFNLFKFADHGEAALPDHSTNGQFCWRRAKSVREGCLKNITSRS